MKRNIWRKALSAVLALIMVAGMIPVSVLTARAGHTCPDCQDWIDGSPYCQECYKCDACIKLCIECGTCSECSGNEICDACSDEEVGDTVCVECAIERGSHCPGCDDCFYEVQLWCQECGLCAECVDICQGCTENMGKGILCVECAAEGESHCPECGGCYFEIQGWCEECLRCTECVPTCEYCSTEEGAILCVECVTDAGMHCPDCTECYGEANGDLCEECGICGNCAEICSTHELCVECAIDNGYHCPGCEACGEDEVICEDCGERCTGCVNEFCDNCSFCGECVQICPECGACSECAEICENCGEYCDQCEGICDDCGLCLVCCEDAANFEGCDCPDWVCIENDEWSEHFEEYHTESEDSHYARPASVWSWDTTYHWRKCVYCEDSGHYTDIGEHIYDAGGNCSECGFVKNTKIQIIEQPQDAYNVYVQSPYETHDESHIAHFSVKAAGSSELTYTWYMGYFAKGEIKYYPLTGEPAEGECYEGPELSVLTYTDSCYSTTYICCVITDEEGNEVKTADVMIHARHDYHYYDRWREHQLPCELAERNKYGHILQCVGEGCEQRTGLRPHVDEDRDDYCDICDYDMPEILVTKQPKSVKNVYVSSSEERHDESNIAHFSVEAEGNSELTYTWCRRYYVGGQLTYRPLSEAWGDPGEGENFDGPNLDIVAPEDACCTTYMFCCFITDEEGNEVRTIDVELKAKHNYQYFKDYLSSCERPYEYVRRFPNGHILQCVGTGCEKKTKLRHHVDEDNNFRCDICDYRSVIDLVELTITPPKEGQTPSYTVGCGSTAYYAVGSMNNGRYWFVSDNGVDNWTLIDNTRSFVADKYYKFSVDLRTASGYEFDRHYSYNSKVLAKVNGGQGFFAQKTYNQDLAHYITVEYVFGICNDSVIENIVIENVTTPVAGEKPAYTASVRGSGYYIDTEKNASYDAWWANPPAMWPYIKNGIGWYDLTKNDWVYDHETFIPGHEYEVCVYLKTEDDYTFWHDKWLDMLFTATVNGQIAEGDTTTSLGLTEQTISSTFTCAPATVSAVEVSGIDAPIAGKTPDYTGQVGNASLYSFAKYGLANAGFWWYDSEGNVLFDEDRFVAGETYSLEIKLTNTMVNQVVASKFQTPVTAKLNGKTVASSDIMANSTTVYIYQTYTCKTAVSVSGTVTSFNDASGDVTLQLIEQGLPEPAYETIVTGNTVNYSFTNVNAGTYTLRVSKKNHVTREYTIVVGSSSVKQDVKICLLGDCNSDGKVNMKDWNRLYEHLNEVSELTGYEWQCADANGDDKVNMKDWNRLYEHLNEVNPLW